jgi:hypothetical protein
MGLGFWGKASRRAYTAAGSFSLWLIETRGVPAFTDLYRSAGDFDLAYGTALADLEPQWLAFLAARELRPQDIESLRQRFKQRAIFQRPCAHRAADLAADANARPGPRRQRAPRRPARAVRRRARTARAPPRPRPRPGPDRPSRRRRRSPSPRSPSPPRAHRHPPRDPRRAPRRPRPRPRRPRPRRRPLRPRPRPRPRRGPAAPAADQAPRRPDPALAPRSSPTSTPSSPHPDHPSQAVLRLYAALQIAALPGQRRARRLPRGRQLLNVGDGPGARDHLERSLSPGTGEPRPPDPRAAPRRPPHAARGPAAHPRLPARPRGPPRPRRRPHLGGATASSSSSGAPASSSSPPAPRLRPARGSPQPRRQHATRA